MMPTLQIMQHLVYLLLALWAAPPAASLPVRDISGMAWLAADTFLVVHDAKNPFERARPRVSLVCLPAAPAGGCDAPLEVAWPGPQGPSSDLESVARLPGTRSFLLVESGNDGSDFQRLFLAEYAGGALHIRAVAAWPVPVENVEGSAVARVGDQLVFLFAERAHGQPSTRLAWAPMTVDPLAFGTFRHVPFPYPGEAGPDVRPVSALEVDRRGRVYAASAVDPGRDDGPFRSAVWEVGVLRPDSTGRPDLRLMPRPLRRAALDGLKVESVAVREQRRGHVELFIGTDDEHYGAVLRPLP